MPHIMRHDWRGYIWRHSSPCAIECKQLGCWPGAARLSALHFKEQSVKHFLAAGSHEKSNKVLYNAVFKFMLCATESTRAQAGIQYASMRRHLQQMCASAKVLG